MGDEVGSGKKFSQFRLKLDDPVGSISRQDCPILIVDVNAIESVIDRIRRQSSGEGDRILISRGRYVSLAKCRNE